MYEATENLCLKEDLEKNLIFKRLNLSVLMSAHLDTAKTEILTH